MNELPILDLDDSFQIRVETKEEKIQQYADDFLERDGWGDFPPIKVVFLNGKYMIADGIHRYNAAKRAGLEMIPCEITNGEYWDLLEKSVEVNWSQGIDMGPKDRKKFRRLVMEAFCKGLIKNKTMTELANLCKCVPATITNMRREMEAEGWTFPETSIGADGKEYPTKFKPREKSTYKILYVDEQKPDLKTGMIFCANGCGTPTYPEHLEAGGSTWIQKEGHWFCSEECADEWNQNRLSDEAERLTGISDKLPANPSARVTTKPNPINYPTCPAIPVKTQNNGVSGDVLEDFTDADEPENILRLEISKNDDETTIAGKISQIFDFVAPSININNIINILINKFNIIINAPSDKKSKSKKSKKREPLPEEEQTGLKWPLVDGTEWELSKTELEDFKKAYPAVDVEDELRRCIIWSKTRPRQRKTINGILKHLDIWLDNEQNKGGTKSGYGNTNQGQRQNRSRYRDAGLSFEDMVY